MSAPVVIYTTRWCPFCILARRLLRKRGVAFEERRVEGRPERFAEMERASGRATVPQVFVGDTHVGGFDDLQAAHRSGELDRLLAGGTGA